MSSEPSVSFDRASEYYDQTRGLEPATMDRVVAVLLAEISDRDCLEIGVGTGRFAIPLAQGGVPLTGLDLAPKMLQRLIVNAGGTRPFPLVLGDATRLPFGDASFEVAIAVHVLHLIPAWRTVLDELARVLGGHGTFLLDAGGWGEGDYEELQDVYCHAAGISKSHPGVNEPEEVDEEMRRRGARVRLLEPVPAKAGETFGNIIDSLETGAYSFTWRVDEQARSRGAQAARAWLTDHGLSPDDVPSATFQIQWRAYDL